MSDQQPPATPDPPSPTETLESIQSRHRTEKKALQARITNKKKNASKKTRKGINDECAALERDLADRQAAEIAALVGEEVPETRTETETEEDVEGKLAGLRIEDSVEGKKQGQIQQQQQHGKKRNRAKERLARRAAEAAAASEAAALEATTLPDHRTLEASAIASSLTAHNLVCYEIPPDGHCLFAAIADQLVARGITAEVLRGETPGYRNLRRVAAEWVRGHRGEYEGFVEGGVDGWTERIEGTAEWGGEVELRALAGALGVEIVVIRGEGEDRIGEGEKRVWLGYYVHGFGLGEHYNSLRDRV